VTISGKGVGCISIAECVFRLRHTFSTLLAENDEDVKTVQSLMRHANSNITMNIYTHAISSKKRRAQSKVVEMILPNEKAASAQAGVA
jgi:integrase